MSSNEITTFICLFHSGEHAESALNALESAGFQRSAITSTWSGDTSSDEDLTAELNHVGVPERDTQHMLDGLRRGGVVLSLEAPESRSGEVERIFHQFTAAKIDEADDVDRRAARAAAVARPLTPPLASAPTSNGAVDSVVVPVVAEELVVGKRTVDRGGVRVYQRLVEESVSGDVSLHEEHVALDRRPVDRAVTPADLRAGDQTIELIETEEVPVVGKVARVVEEVHVGRVGSDRTERIDDVVRHTEVEVEETGAIDRERAASATDR